ncbi:SMI1 / KNR4 family protein [compost metagenome]
MIESEQPISKSDFLEFTQSINAHPTSEFMNFYLTNNGGFIDDKQHTESELLINSFLSIKHGEATIENVYKQLVKSTPSLAGLIPFAYDDCGNLFLLSTNNDDNGCVYLWLPSESEKFPISDTFNSFLHILSSA